jgi:serine/threonine-protein kinase RsbW
VTGAYPVLQAGSSGLADSDRPARPWVRTFPGVAASVPEARRFVTGLLTGCPAREVLVVCVSELSTNAIVHTASGNGGVFTVEVELPRDGTARISVTDAGRPSLPAAGRPSLPAAGSPRRSAPLDPASPFDAAAALDPAATLDVPAPVESMAEGGRGLALVAACTSRWGYVDAHPGRTVWAEACWPVPVPPPGQEVPGSTARQPRPRFPRLPRSPRRLARSPRRLARSPLRLARSSRSSPRLSPGPSGEYPSGPAA